LNDQTFWTRYFRSKLFNRHRSSARQSGDAVKEDEIFDKYLGDDDDGIEPKQINTREVFKLLDLAATQEDHAEVCELYLRTKRFLFLDSLLSHDSHNQTLGR
jgi:transcription initiation factor TFIIH subunit 1